MAETHQSENQGGKEVEIAEVTKFLHSLDLLLTENRDILTILPELIRKQVHELEAHSTQNTRTVSADNTGDTSGKVGKRREEPETWMTQQDEMEKRIISLTEELKDANQKIEDLQTKIKQSDNNLEMLKERKRNQGDANYFTSKYKDLKAKSRTTHKELMAKQERIEELERKLDSKQEECDKEKEQIRQKCAEKENIVKEQKKEIRLLKEEHQKIFEAQQTGLHELEARVSELDKELASKEDVFKEQKQRLEKELAESEKTVSELDKELTSKEDVFKEQKQRLEKELVESEKTIADLQKKLDSRQEEYDKEKEQNKQKFAEKENTVKGQKKEIRLLKVEHQKIFEAQQTGLHELEARVSELDKELASKEDVFKEQKQRLEKELAESEKTLRSEKLERERAKKHYVDELRDKETKMRTLGARNEKLSADVEKNKMELRHYIESFQRQEVTYKSDLTLKETEISKTKERLSHREKEVKTLIHEVQRYKSRLASLCEKRVNQDQRSVENVLASNRPSDVERDFKEFFDGTREDARDVIQSVYGSEEKKDVDIYYPRIVCTILVAAYEVTKNVKEAVLDLFKVSTKKLILKAPEVGQNYNLTRMDDNFVFNPITIDVCDKSEESTDVIDALLNSLKESAHICNLKCLENDVREHAWKIWNEWYEETSSFTLAPSQKVLTELIRSGYIEACLRLAWRMVTQRPPLRLEYNSSIFDHHTHKKANGDTSLEEITCYLWPCLFDGGAKLICPGLVLCKM